VGGEGGVVGPGIRRCRRYLRDLRHDVDVLTVVVRRLVSGRGSAVFVVVDSSSWE
jgi:hypothetical protein